jgi:hypothetical protein
MFQIQVPEKIKTHILRSVIFFLNRAIYEVKWKNIVKLDRSQIRIWCTRIACWISKATNKYVILIAFPLQKWLHEHASMLCHMYIACLVQFGKAVIYIV